MNEPEMRSTKPSRHLSRRQVLAMGTLAGVAPLIPHGAFANELATASLLPVAGRVSASYFVGSESVLDINRFLAAAAQPGVTDASAQLAAYRVVPAESVATDASMWQGPVRVRIHGLYPSADARRDMFQSTVSLDVHVPSRDPATAAATLPFHAWTFDARGPNTSPPNSFALPVHKYGSLELHFGIRTADGRTDDYVTRFVPGDVMGSPRLRRGLYLFTPPLTASPQLGTVGLDQAVRAPAGGPISIMLSFSAEGETLARS